MQFGAAVAEERLFFCSTFFPPWSARLQLISTHFVLLMVVLVRVPPFLYLLASPSLTHPFEVLAHEESFSTHTLVPPRLSRGCILWSTFSVFCFSLRAVVCGRVCECGEKRLFVASQSASPLYVCFVLFFTLSLSLLREKTKGWMPSSWQDNNSLWRWWPVARSSFLSVFFYGTVIFAFFFWFHFVVGDYYVLKCWSGV